jgi:anti-sigma regulatory factor (Ser/Thr protein kinase)
MASTPPPTPIELELVPEPNSVSRARHELRHFAAQLEADADAVALAVSEAVTNVVLHAYRGARQGMIAIRAEVNGDDKLLVSVVDRGVGMRPDPQQGGLGLGLPLIGEIADSVEISSRDEGGVELRMRFGRAA